MVNIDLFDGATMVREIETVVPHRPICPNCGHLMRDEEIIDERTGYVCDLLYKCYRCGLVAIHSV